MATVWELTSKVTAEGVEDTTRKVAGVGKAHQDAATASEGASGRQSAALANIGKGAQLAGLAIAAGLGVGIRANFELEETLTRIPALVGDVGMSVDDMRDSLASISSSTAQGPTQLAEALFSITSAGFAGKEALDILDSSARAAAAGMGTTGDVAFAAGSVVNAYGSDVYDAAAAIDIMVGTVKAGNLSAEDLAGSLGKVLPIASAAGISLEDVGGAVALITRSGSTAAEAVTQVKAAIQAMNAPTQSASRLLTEAGYSADDLRMAIKDRGLIGGMELMEKASGGNASTMREMFGSSEALSGALTILNSSADGIAGTFGAVQESAGLTDKAFQITADSGAFKAKEAFNNLKLAAMDLAVAATPLATMAAELTTKFIGFFTSLPGPIQHMIVMSVAAAGVASKLGVLGSVVGGLGQAVAAAAKMMMAANPALLAVGVAAAIAVPIIINLIGKKNELEDATNRVAEAFATERGAMDLSTDAMAEYIDASSRFNTRNQIDDLDRLGLSYNDVAKMMQNGTDGYVAFIEAAARGGEITRETADALIAGALAGKGYEETLGDMTAQQKLALQGNGDLIKSFDLEAQAMQNAAKAGVETMLRFEDVTQAAVDQAVAMNILADGTTDWVGVQQDLNSAASDTAVATNTATDATGEYADVVGDTAGAVADLTVELHDVAKAFDELIGVNLSAEEAHFKAIDAVNGLTQSLKDNGTELDINSEKGRSNRDAVRDAIEAAFDHSQAIKDQGGTMVEQRNAFNSHITDLRNSMLAAGFTKAEVDKLISSYGLVPDSLNTVYSTTGIAANINGWDQLASAISRVPTHITTTHTQVTVSTGSGNTAGNQKGNVLSFMQGGFSNWAETEGRMVELHGQEFVLNAKAVRDIRNGKPLAQAVGGGAGGAAGGLATAAGHAGTSIGQVNVYAGLGAGQVDGARIGRQLVQAVQDHEATAGATFTRDDAPGSSV